MQNTLESIKQKIISHQKHNNVKLLAVSKTWASSDIIDLYNQGQRLFGESRLQEAQSKFLFPPLADLRDIKLHMIGRLQRNKVKKALQIFDCIQSVDRMELAEKMIQESKNLENIKTRDIFLQINPQADENKAGCVNFEKLVELAKFFLHEKVFNICGVMYIASLQADVRTSFSHVRQWAYQLKDVCNLPTIELSMGMSSDFPIAIEEGSTMVRIGSALFGGRNYV